MNTALRIVLDKRESYKYDIEENILTNVKNNILPILKKLKNGPQEKISLYVDILEINLQEIISPFSKKLSYKYLDFTPMEIQVSNYVKQGMKTKEIASLLNLSSKTIEDHRKHIRQKLGISGVRANLRSRLLFIGDEG